MDFNDLDSYDLSINNITSSEGEYSETGNFPDEIVRRIENVCISLDENVSPEAVSFFESINFNDFDAYELATELVQCDESRDMSRDLFDLIVVLYQLAIEEGNENAMNDLGALYYDGRGCEQDFTKAVYYYDMAARNGSRQAQENLGYCYYYGRNMPVDYEKAFHYYALGAFDGHLISLYKIGDMYQNGYYVEKNEKEAFYIYCRCLEIMTDEAAPFAAGPVYLRVGNCLLNGKGVESDPLNALTAFQRAEYFLYNMVAKGDVMYRKSLESAVEGQKKAREKLLDTLPDRKWNHDL